MLPNNANNRAKGETSKPVVLEDQCHVNEAWALGTLYVHALSYSSGFALPLLLAHHPSIIVNFITSFQSSPSFLMLHTHHIGHHTNGKVFIWFQKVLGSDTFVFCFDV